MGTDLLKCLTMLFLLTIVVHAYTPYDDTET